MRQVIAASTNKKSFSRALVVVGSALLTLAGCAVDASPEAEDATGTTAEELRSTGGGGGGLGFTCENGTCTCSKSIEGDCDRMRKNCTGDLTGLDNCIAGWLTTDCTCTYALVRPPVGRFPRPVVVGGVLASP